MSDAEKLMVRQAVKTMETFNSYHEINIAARKAAQFMMDPEQRCIIFTGISLRSIEMHRFFFYLFDFHC